MGTSALANPPTARSSASAHPGPPPTHGPARMEAGTHGPSTGRVPLGSSSYKLGFIGSALDRPALLKTTRPSQGPTPRLRERPANQIHRPRTGPAFMKVCKHESSRMLSGRQEETLNDPDGISLRTSTSVIAHFTRLLFYFKSRRCRHIKVNLKLEAGASESSPPSQSESPARALPGSDASISEICMTPPKRQKGWLT